MVISPNDVKPVIKELINSGRMSIFAGSGISVESGLPTWDGFVDKYIEICEALNSSIKDPYLKFDEIIDDAKRSRDSDLISAISALKGKVEEVTNSGINTDQVDEQLNDLFTSAHPNEYHKSIVSTNYKHIITTNYDTLLERAARELGYDSFLTRSYSYNEQKNLSIAIYSGESAIIHAHGKIILVKLNQFVLTKDDYLAIMKHNPGFRLIMNSLFLTSSVLFAGYGGSDPHFEDIIDDLNATLQWDNEGSGLPRCYIMLRRDKIAPIRDYLSNKRRVDIISFDEYSEMKAFLKELSDSCPRPK